MAPGIYQVQLLKIEGQKCYEIGNKVSVEIEVIPGFSASIKGMNPSEAAAFWVKLDQTYSDVELFNEKVSQVKGRIETMHKALTLSNKIMAEEFSELSSFSDDFLSIELIIYGSKIKQQIGEENEYPTVYHYLGVVSTGVGDATYGPTPTHLKCMNAAVTLLEKAKKELEVITNTLPSIENKLRDAGIKMELD